MFTGGSGGWCCLTYDGIRGGVVELMVFCCD